MNRRIEKGKKGEQLVAQYLKDRGYSILAVNFRHFLGEIDIIAHTQDIVAFVEVKWRSNPLVDPAEIINYTKQKKISTVAKLFLSQHTKYQECVHRFDVALIEENNTTITIRYIIDAFFGHN